MNTLVGQSLTEEQLTRNMLLSTTSNLCRLPDNFKLNIFTSESCTMMLRYGVKPGRKICQNCLVSYITRQALLL